MARAKTRKLFLALLIVGVSFVPAPALALVRITEIMYDTPGGDTGHEWLEITNLGSESVDVSKYKVFESNANHGLTIVTGDAVLAPHTAAIIAKNPVAFTTDNPNFSGTLFKASFALSNTGEELVLKNASSSVVDSVSYASSQGASGNGASLHRLSSSIKAGKPDPGIYSEKVIALAPKVVSVPQKITAKKTPKPLSSLNPKAPAADPTDPAVSPALSEVAAAAAAPEVSHLSSLLEGLLALVALVLLGMASVWYSKSLVSQGEAKPPLAPEEFDIEG